MTESRPRGSCLRRGICCRSAECPSCGARIRPTCTRNAERRPPVRGSPGACPAPLRPATPASHVFCTPKTPHTPFSAFLKRRRVVQIALHELRARRRRDRLRCIAVRMARHRAKCEPLPASARAVAPPCFPVAPVIRIRVVLVRHPRLLDSSTLATLVSFRLDQLHRQRHHRSDVRHIRGQHDRVALSSRARRTGRCTARRRAAARLPGRRAA